MIFIIFDCFYTQNERNFFCSLILKIRFVALNFLFLTLIEFFRTPTNKKLEMLIFIYRSRNLFFSPTIFLSIGLVCYTNFIQPFLYYYWFSDYRAIFFVWISFLIKTYSFWKHLSFIFANFFFRLKFNFFFQNCKGSRFFIFE